jgi:hypothetical protein
MRTLDKFEALRESARFAVAFLHNPDTGDFALVELEPVVSPAPESEDFAARGLQFYGILALTKNGTPKSALADSVDPVVIEDASVSFAALCVEHLKRPRWLMQHGKSVN